MRSVITTLPSTRLGYASLGNAIRWDLSKYPNVHVGYWGDLVPSVPGMSNDGIHLKTDAAKQAYADLIAGWTGVKSGG